jgi:hypothetical protein
LTGLSVSSAGDFNGDGYDDVIVGAPYAASGDGEAYLIFGRSTGPPSSILDALDPADGFTLSGGFTGGAGWDVSSGDVNGDGFGDLIVGAHYEEYYGTAYVIFGKDGDPGDFSDITSPPSIRPTASPSSARSNMTGPRSASPRRRHQWRRLRRHTGRRARHLRLLRASRLYRQDLGDLRQGRPASTDIDLGALDPADGFVITGFEDYDETGYSVGSGRRHQRRRLRRDRHRNALQF